MNEISIREQKLYQIKYELDKRKRKIVDKGKILKKHTNENEFLQIVLDDYKKYYNHIIDTKKKQLEEFNRLKQYIIATKSNIHSIDINIDRAKLDYKDINNEITKLKSELDQMISNDNINE